MSTTLAQAASTVAAAVAASSSAANRAPPQGGVLDGQNPTVYDPKNPIIVFIIQVIIIIIFCRLLHYPLSLIRQPRVIAEVIGGIILGPSVMFRIPGFQQAIFPKESMQVLNLVANLGLILFLFLVALETDMRLFMKNWRVALSVGLAGMILPFGLGCAISYGLYYQFRTDEGIVPISFGVYMLFIGTALSITAFPVLCRILTELNLLSTPVGVTVLAAGVGNDVVGWVLLALCVALVNNGSGLTALYVVLCTVGWVLFLVFAVRPVLIWLLRRTGSIQNGPTQGMVTLVLLLTLFSSWFTGIIGVHPIFGGFLVGLICPHDEGFTIKLTEKIEDLVTVLFLPLYFTLSGLNTNLGMLNDKTSWAYVVGITGVAFFGKIVGGTLAARSCRLVWRESLTIGVLMSCKGLVELIVLNIGLQAKILSTRTFTMFVVMALVTTVTTTPATALLYPPWYQKKLESWKRGDTDWAGNELRGSSDYGDSVQKIQSTKVGKLLVYLRLESLPSLFTFIDLLGGEKPTPVPKVHKSKLAALSDIAEVPTHSSDPAAAKPLEVYGLRLLPLTERTSSVMRVSETDEYAHSDPVVNAFRTFAQLNDVAVSGGVSIIPESAFADELTSRAADLAPDLVLIPWSETGSVAEGDSLSASLGGARDPKARFGSGPHASFVARALDDARCNTAVLVNHGFGGPAPPAGRLTRSASQASLRPREVTQTVADRSHHVFCAFVGGVDDRAALRFVLQVAGNSSITATIVHVRVAAATAAAEAADAEISVPAEVAEVGGSSRHGSRKGSKVNLAITAAAASAPDVAAAQEQDAAFLHALRDSLPAGLGERVVFSEVEVAGPGMVAGAVLEAARGEVGLSARNAGDLVVVGRNAVAEEGGEVGRVLGQVAEAVILGGVRGSVLVVKAAGRGLEM